MEETIGKLTEEIIEKVSGFSLTDQAGLLFNISSRLRIEAFNCLSVEYGLTDIDEEESLVKMISWVNNELKINHE